MKVKTQAPEMIKKGGMFFPKNPVHSRGQVVVKVTMSLCQKANPDDPRNCAVALAFKANKRKYNLADHPDSVLIGRTISYLQHEGQHGRHTRYINLSSLPKNFDEGFRGGQIFVLGPSKSRKASQGRWTRKYRLRKRMGLVKPSATRKPSIRSLGRFALPRHEGQQ